MINITLEGDIKMTADASQSKENEYSEIMNRVSEKSKNKGFYLRKLGDEHAFKLKTTHSNVIAEITLLEDLHKAIQNAPLEAIAFHIKDGNDFANWINYVVGDWGLGSQINTITETDPRKAKTKILEVMGGRISRLKLV